MRKAYEIMKDQRVAISASMIFNFGVSLGIYIDPTKNTPALVQDQFGIPTIFPFVAHLLGGLILLLALRGRSINLYVMGNAPVVTYALFTLATLHYGSTPLPAGIMLCLLMYVVHEVTIWTT